MTAADALKPLLAVLSVLRRWLSWTLIACGLYVAVGCAIYPEWWYPFLWKGGFKSPRNYAALLDEVQRVPIAASLVVVGIGALLFWYHHRRESVTRFMSANGFLLRGLSVLVMIFAALLVNATQHKKWQMIVMAQRVNELGDQLLKVADDATRISLEPPVSYYVSVRRNPS